MPCVRSSFLTKFWKLWLWLWFLPGQFCGSCRLKIFFLQCSKQMMSKTLRVAAGMLFYHSCCCLLLWARQIIWNGKLLFVFKLLCVRQNKFERWFMPSWYWVPKQESWKLILHYEGFCNRSVRSNWSEQHTDLDLKLIDATLVCIGDTYRNGFVIELYWL